MQIIWILDFIKLHKGGKSIKGKIIKNISNTYIVNVNNVEYEAVARGRLKMSEIKPVVGDDVELEETGEGKAVITEILERKNYLKRPKVSNISQVIFVVTPKMPNLNSQILDKQLAFAEFLYITPIIVINKIDLSEEKAEKIYEIYTKSGFKVIKMQAEIGKGIEELKKVLHDNTSVLAGQSGVGKSTITNKILNKEIAEIGDISKKNQRGKNTTTDINLYELEKNTYLLDTPGFQTIDIFEIESKTLDKYFIEFRKYIEKCEFVRLYSYKRRKLRSKRSGRK